MRLEVLTEVSDGGATVHLLVRLNADATPSSERPPVNLALVLDRSSSMRGPRMSQAKRAARSVVERLDHRDRLTVIAFDGSAQVVFGPDGITPESRERLVRALDELDTGVGTNLGAAMKQAADKIRATFVRNAVARVVLLTDGQPSIGITDPDKLGALAAVEAQSGVTITAMGIGEGFHDDLLADIARRGRGGFYYLASPADIPAAFGRELSGLFAIAATCVELRVVPHEHVTALDLMHRLSSRPQEDGLSVDIGEVAAGEPRQMLFRLTRDPSSESRHLATLRLIYRGPDGKPGDAAILGVEMPRLPLGEESRLVMLERLCLAVASAVDTAWARRAAGDRDHAAAALVDIRRQVLAARGQAGAPTEITDRLLDDLTSAAEAIHKSSEEREKIRRRMRERSQITLLGQSAVARLPVEDDE